MQSSRLLGAKVRSFVEACNKIRAIHEEIALYFDVCQNLTVSVLQRPSKMLVASGSNLF